jgi:transcriptional regulator with XRE-family HTH domain
MDTLGKRVKSRREALQLSQAALASLAGLKQADVSKIENGDIQQTTRAAQLARANRARRQ